MPQVLTEHDTCRKGLHLYTPENIKVFPSGKRTCLLCHREAERLKRRRHRAELRAAGRERYDRLNTEQRRDRTLKKYGLTVETFDAMLVAQGGGCAICGTTVPGDRWNTHFHVDHDHVTGTVRGLLCGLCNRTLGNAKDDPQRLRDAACYLERTR